MYSITYISILDKNKSPGVYGKINGTVYSFNQAGCNAKSLIIKPAGIRGYYHYITSIINCKSDIIFIRYIPNLAIFYFLFFTFFCNKKKIICDVPTPLVNLKNELGKGLLKKIKFKFQYYLIFPFSFIGMDLILDYAVESRYIKLFSSRKRLDVSNCVDTKNIDILENKVKNFNFIAVGTIAKWHGWDIFLEGLNLYRERNDDIQKFNILFVGDGPEYNNLLQLVNKYNFHNIVSFTGLVPFENISNLYKGRSIGLGSLAWHRVGVTRASPIKSREYLINGLSVLYSTYDKHLENCKTGYRLEDYCKPEHIVTFLEDMDDCIDVDSKYSRNFAIQNCSFTTYVNDIICRLK